MRTRPSRIGPWDLPLISFALWSLACHATVFLGRGVVFLVSTFLALEILLLVGVLSRIRSGRLEWSRARRLSPFQTAMVLFAALAAVAISLIAHRPDPEDTQWIHWAVDVADNPAGPFLQANTSHAPPLGPMKPPTYRFLSLELLVGTLSWLTGLSAISIFHLGLSPLGALLMIGAYRSLFARLHPRAVGAATLGVLVFLFLQADTHQSWGNFSLVRMHQGKALFVSVLLPLLILLALRLARRPNRWNLVTLAAAQTAAFALTPTSIFVAPAVAVLALLAGLPRHLGPRPAALRVAGAAATAGYPAVLGLSTYFATASKYLPISPQSLPESDPLVQTLATVWTRSVGMVFQSSDGLWLALLAFVIVALFAPSRTARRIALIFPIAGLLFVYNPLARQAIVHYAMGYHIYWRTFWILPVPMIVALALTTYWSQPLRRRRGLRGVAAVVSLALLVGFAALDPRHMLSPSNGVRLGRPTLKVPRAFATATTIRDRVGGSPALVGPNQVTIWLPTLHQAPRPLCSWTRLKYQLGSHNKLRLALKAYVTGSRRPPTGTQELVLGVERLRIGAVVLHHRNRWRSEIEDTLASLGFTSARIDGRYDLWTRSVADTESSTVRIGGP